MVTKDGLLKCSVANFTKFGSKRFTLDELAKTLGISKKTIYKYYRSKDDLVFESVQFLIQEFVQEIDKIQHLNKDPITKIILIYIKGFERIQHFKPSFIFGLKKYYPKANTLFDDFRDTFVNHTIYNLLKAAKSKGHIKEEVQLELFCALYFKRIEEIAFRNDNLFEENSIKEICNHFIVYSLRGIASENYENEYF